MENIQAICGTPSASAIGRVSELLAASKLLDMGYSVAVPVVDDAGVDLVVNYRSSPVTVQVRASNWVRFGIEQTRYVFSRLQDRGIRADVYVFHGRKHDLWWVIPAKELFGAPNTLVLDLAPSTSGRGRPSRTKHLHSYRDAWRVLGDPDGLL